MAWFWQGIITSIVAAGLCGMLIWLRKRLSPWASAILYGVSGAACVFVIFLCFYGAAVIHSYLPVIPPTTSANVQERIQAWAEKFEFGVTKPKVDQTVFAMELRSKTGRVFKVAQLNSTSGYIVIASTIAVSPEHMKILTALSNDQKTRVIDQLGTELAKTRMPLNSRFGIGELAFGTETRLPIDSSLTEDTFMRSIDQLD